MISGPYHIAGSCQIISEHLRDRRPDLLLRRAVNRHKDHCRRRLGSFDPFRMIVGHFRCHCGDLKHFLKALLAQPGGRRHPHRAAVPETPVRLRVLFVQPHAEISTVAREGISLPVFLHGLDDRLLHHILFGVNTAVHKPLGHRQSHDAVVRKLRTLRKELEIRRLYIILIKFIGASDNISQNSAVHQYSPLSRT